MGITIKEGTGRAECRICKTKIKKDQTQIVFSAYKCTESYHYKCIRRGRFKLKQLNLSKITAVDGLSVIK